MPLPKLPSRPAALLDVDALTQPKPAASSPSKAANAPTPDVSLTATREAKSTPAPMSGNEPASNLASRPQKTTRTTRTERQPSMLKTVQTDSPAIAPTRDDKKQSTTHKKHTRARKAKPNTASKLFVLDTNVLMHDPTSLFRFEEHDVYLPMMTLEELDHHKKGMSEVARNARQVSRSLDALIENLEQLDLGIELNRVGNKDATGRLFFQTTAIAKNLPDDLPMGKADNQILGVVRALQEQFNNREVVLVSKDINMRLKARALGLAAEDYFNDHVLEDTDLLYSGVQVLPEDFWTKHGKDIESWQQGGITFYRIKGPLCSQFMVNQFVYFEGQLPLHAQVREVSGKTSVLATLRDYTHAKNNIWGITARNREQNFAMNLLMDPDVDFVSLLGQAGTGKTLLTLAAALTQVLETQRYAEIIMTRVTVPVGEDIGFLPGTEEEKMMPWMGALEDNLDVLNMGEGDGNTGGGNEWGRAATMDLIRSRIKIKSLNFMRGRTFLNKFLIIDEAQNLTPKQMKTLITRAGPGTKVVCLGNIAQIDTPYLTEGSSGLTFVVDRFKGWPHAGHITLQRGERSRLADYAGDAL